MAFLDRFNDINNLSSSSSSPISPNADYQTRVLSRLLGCPLYYDTSYLLNESEGVDDDGVRVYISPHFLEAKRIHRGEMSPTQVPSQSSRKLDSQPS